MALRIYLWELLSLLLLVSTSSCSAIFRCLLFFFAHDADRFTPHFGKRRIAKECMAGKQDGKAYSRSAI